MFTWNIQYISKARLAEAFGQLMLDSSKGDILIRIHTAIHLEEEAVDLAKFIANLVPGAHIFGTSTSAIISATIPPLSVANTTAGFVKILASTTNKSCFPRFLLRKARPTSIRSVSIRDIPYINSVELISDILI